MNRKLSILVLAAASAVGAPSMADTIYRCGDSYSQKPCEGAKLLQADDARSVAQGSQASAAAQRDAKLADAMEKARLKEEAKPAQVYIPPAKVVAKAEDTDKKPVMAKPKKPQYFSAVSPRKPAEEKKKKAPKKDA